MDYEKTRKFLFWIFVGLALLAMIAAANRVFGSPHDPGGQPAAAEKAKPDGGICPKTLVKGEVSDCFKCHIAGSFKVRPAPFDALIEYPNAMTRLIQGGNSTLYGRFVLKGTIILSDTDRLLEAFAFFEKHPITHIEILIESGGGEMFGGWSAVSAIEEFKKGHPAIPVHAKVHGFAGSAAFLIFLAADTRIAGPQAYFMWHEVYRVTFLSVDTASTVADDKQTLDLFQKVANEYIHQRTGIPMETINAEIFKKLWWFAGEKALKLGVATQLTAD